MWGGNVLWGAFRTPGQRGCVLSVMISNADVACTDALL